MDRGVDRGVAHERGEVLARGGGQRRERGGLQSQVVLGEPAQVTGHEGVVAGGAGGVEHLGGGRKGKLAVKAGGAQGPATGGLGAGARVGSVERKRVLLAGGRALVGLLEQGVPRVGVMARPALEAPAGAQQARSTVERLAGGLHEHGSLASPQGSEDRGAVANIAVPAARGEHHGGVVCAQRRDLARRARIVAAVKERLAREVDGHGRAIARKAHVDGHVGRVGVDHRAHASRGEELVGDGVLGTKGDELSVAQVVIRAVRVDHKGGAGREVTRPVDGLDALVERIGVARAHAGEHKQDAGGQAAPQASAIRVGKLAPKGDLASQLADLRYAKRRQLLCQQLLEPLGARGNKLHSGTPFARRQLNPVDFPIAVTAARRRASSPQKGHCAGGALLAIVPPRRKTYIARLF